MRARALGAGLVVALAGALLSGCVPNDAAGAIAVAIDDTSCAVAAPTATAGDVTFALTNGGSDLNEFEILAADQLRIVGEKENLPPTQTANLTVTLAPGTYYTACRFRQVGEPIGLAEFTVGGSAPTVGADHQRLIDRAQTLYLGYIRDQVGRLIPATQKLVDAYEAGDDATARTLFAQARIPYERIEPSAGSFGDLDPRIDYREVDAAAEGLAWTGFHRIEKDLWPPAADALDSDGTSATLHWTPSTDAERTTIGDGLVADVAQLRALVTASDFSITLADISNGAVGLLDEVATGKISGEEDWWSHTDLTDFQANVEGAEVAYGYVREIAAAQGSSGTQLVTSIDAAFAALDAELAQYGSLTAGFVGYDTVDDSQRKRLSDLVNALAEPLSRLTSTVLG